MPLIEKWIDNEIALHHQGTTIYHVYKNDEWDEGRRTYWFTTRKDGCEGDDDAFDVRDLPGWRKEDDIEETLRLAIEQDLLDPLHVERS